MSIKSEMLHKIQQALDSETSDFDKAKVLQKALDNYSFKDKAKAKFHNLGEDIDNFSDNLHKSRHDLRNQLGDKLKENKTFRMGMLGVWVVVTLVFLILTGIVYNKTTHDTPALGLLITIILLHIINLLCVAFNRTIISFAVSFISFVLSMALLFKQEKDLDCGKDLSTYRVYMSAHTFNVVLFFFSLMRLLL